MVDIVVLTDERYENVVADNQYAQNVYREDQLVINALIEKGLNVKKVAWSNPSFDWSSTKFALFRTTWDYAEKFNQFADWLMEVSLKTKLINSYDLISWNLDKHYLDDLGRSGVAIVETLFLEPGESKSLKELHLQQGWDHTVLKPTISAAAKDTYQLTGSSIESHEEVFKSLIKSESMMLQPFINSVVEKGEISLVMINGIYSHAVLKIAKTGDFRVQDDFGGTVHTYEPTPGEIDLAVQAVEACDSLPFYARVDIVDDNNGNPAISELELIEPELWFRQKPESATLLAEAITSKLF